MQLKETNDQLSTLSNDSANPPSQSMFRAIQRHRDVYQDYSREFKRTKVGAHHSFELQTLKLNSCGFQTNVQTALDKANLLSGVRNDIE